MAFVNTTDAARIVINYGKGSEQFSNVLHATKTGFADSDMTTLAGALDSWISSNYISNLSNDVAYQNVTIYDIRTIGGSVVSDNSGAAVGGAAVDALPINVAIVVTLYTATRGRSGRGRLYLAGFSENATVDGIFTSAIESVAEAFAANMMSIMSNNGWTWGVRSQQQNGVALDPAVVRPITSYDVRNLLPGTQRRRVDRP